MINFTLPSFDGDYEKLLNLIKSYRENYGVSLGIKEPITFTKNAAYNNYMRHEIEIVDRFSRTVTQLKLITSDIIQQLQKFEECTRNQGEGIEMLFIRLEYLSELWYYKAYKLLDLLSDKKSDPNMPKISISMRDPLAENINRMRNHVVEHDTTKNNNERLYLNQISIGGIGGVKLRSVKTKKGEIHDDGIFINTTKFLELLIREFSNYSFSSNVSN
jgi:hypothetical protein